ncbi:MAG: DAK2 domain-containing protein [Dehalococcoidales bacterium]|nr:DAK2 domain-containing protein [Dehalococcoidales bacterium]
MFAAATNWLERVVPGINALNVYPVPDGDCGTNMLFTMRASLAEATKATGNSVSAVSQAMAKGALMGARGNSGVILSQIWRGLAESLKTKVVINGKTFAEALSEASATAYHALSNPVEGTILTVIKDTANAARNIASANGNLVSVLETSVIAARNSVVNTPNLLTVLKEAGVVDAGGHGLYTLLEGAMLHLKGEIDSRSPQMVASDIPVAVSPVENEQPEEEAYGFCTQFLLTDDNLDVAQLRNQLKNMGKSLIVVGDTSTIRVHIHTLEPEKVTKLAATVGTLSDIDIRNMDEQHKDFLLMNREKAAMETAVVAVVNGDGLANVFSSLGVAAIVPGGQSMNPSTMDILQAVEAVPSKNIIVLPNNKNIILTANQIISLTKKRVMVMPTETMPQGVSAMVAFVPETSFADLIENIAEAIAKVKTLEITRATRSTRLDGLDIKEGQYIGLLDGTLYAAADKPSDVVFNLLSRIDISGASIVTIYFGVDTKETDTEEIRHLISSKYPSLETEVVNGGQPHYHFIISVE